MFRPWSKYLKTFRYFTFFLQIKIFLQIFHSLVVKRNVIISNKHGIYELPHELPNNLKTFHKNSKGRFCSEKNLTHLTEGESLSRKYDVIKKDH